MLFQCRISQTQEILRFFSVRKCLVIGHFSRFPANTGFELAILRAANQCRKESIDFLCIFIADSLRRDIFSL
jgi:hypothetical protein